MKVRFLAFVFLCCLTWTLDAQAQQRELSIEVAYPLPIGDTFLSQYDGRVGGSAMLGQPLAERLLLRVGIQYNRLHWNPFATSANIYTLRAGLAYLLQISKRIVLSSEAGPAYSRIGFQYDSEVTPSVRALNGGGFWISLSPHYEVGERWTVGIAAEYRATFMEQADDALNTPFNREYHALVFSLVGTYRF